MGRHQLAILQKQALVVLAGRASTDSLGSPLAGDPKRAAGGLWTGGEMTQTDRQTSERERREVEERCGMRVEN